MSMEGAAGESDAATEQHNEIIKNQITESEVSVTQAEKARAGPCFKTQVKLYIPSCSLQRCEHDAAKVIPSSIYHICL